MRTLVLASSNDPAGTSVVQKLINEHGFDNAGNFENRDFYQKNDVGIAYTNRSIVEADQIEERFFPEFHIFASKHAANSEIPTMTAHFPGNFMSEVKLGGNSQELSYSYPNLLKAYMRNLFSLKDKVTEFDIVIEATHHGPTSLKRPVLFVEIGPSEKQWVDQKAASVVAEAIWKTLVNVDKHDKVAIGLGGTHYSYKFTKFIAESDFALASVAPKHSLQYIDKKMLEQMVNKSVEPVHYAALDWKGMGKDKSRILGLVKEAGLETIRL